MKHFQYADVTAPGWDTPVFFCSDSMVVQEFYEEIKKKFPSHKLENSRNDLSGNMVYVEIKGLSGKDYEVNAWLLQQMCQKGWEPFSVAYSDTSGHAMRIHLRLEIDE